jgi:hypothetical protein
MIVRLEADRLRQEYIKSLYTLGYVDLFQGHSILFKIRDRLTLA